MEYNNQYKTIEDILNNYDENEDDNSNYQTDNQVVNSQPVKKQTYPPGINEYLPNPNLQKQEENQIPQISTKTLPLTAQAEENNSDTEILKKKFQLSDGDINEVKNGTNILDVLINKLNKPKELDEKQLDKNRMIGSIGDSVIQLAKMLAVSKGAYIQPSDPKNSLTNYFLSEENKLRDIYRKNQDAYNRIRLNNALQQYNQQNNREYQKDQQTKKWEHEDQKTLNDQAFKSSESQKNREASASIAAKREEELNTRENSRLSAQKTYQAQRIAIEQQRANNSKGNTGKKDYYDLYAEGINNPDFKKYMDDNPDLFYDITKNNIGIETSRKLKGNPSAIGASYEVWKNSHQNNQPDNQSQNSKTNAPAITKYQANDISNIVKKYPNDDKSQIRDIAVYLQNEGYSREEAGAIIKSLQ